MFWSKRRSGAAKAKAVPACLQPMMVEGRVALVTGASKGLGLEMVRACAA
jgi:hypothetical protein